MLVWWLTLVPAGLVVCGDSGGAGAAPWVQLNDGQQVPALGLGTWLGLTDDYTLIEVTDDKVRQAVEWAIDAGYRHFDTAYIYDTEALVGKGVNNKIAQGVVKREDIFITTKLWNNRHALDQVVPALKESLKMLNMTYVDLYLIHFPIATCSEDPYSPQIDIDYVETWRGMIKAKELGLAKSIGVANFNATQLERLMNETSTKPAMLQVEVNLNYQQSALRAFCRSHDITVTGYTPFGSLFYERAREDSPPPRVDDPKLTAIAAKYKKTVPEVTLRYLHELGVIIIPKSVQKSHIEENVDIFDFCLSQQDRDQLKGFDVGYKYYRFDQWLDTPY